MAGQGSLFHKRLSSARWERSRQAALKRAGWRCTSCGKAGALECHHLKPLHRGGLPFDPANIRVLCRSCHFSAHRRPVSPEVEAWRQLMRDLHRD